MSECSPCIISEDSLRRSHVRIFSFRRNQIRPPGVIVGSCHLRSTIGISAGIREFDVMPSGCLTTPGCYEAGTLPLYPTVDTKQAVAMATRALFRGIKGRGAVVWAEPSQAKHRPARTGLVLADELCIDTDGIYIIMQNSSVSC